MEDNNIKKYFEKQYPQQGIPKDYFITFDEYVERQRLVENETGKTPTPIALLFSVYDQRYKYSYDGDNIQTGDVVLVFNDMTEKKLHFIAERNLNKLSETHEYVGIDENSVIPNFKINNKTKSQMLKEDIIYINKKSS